MKKIFAFVLLLAHQALAQVQQPLTTINNNQLVVTIGIGQPGSIQQVNMLVSQNYGPSYSLMFGQNLFGNSILNLETSGSVGQTTFGSFNSEILDCQGQVFNATVYLGQNNAVPVPNFQFVYLDISQNINQLSLYANYTNITGILSAQDYGFLWNTTFNGFSLNVATPFWSWNPNYNSSIPSSPTICFGCPVSLSSNSVTFQYVEGALQNPFLVIGDVVFQTYSNAIVSTTYQYINLPNYIYSGLIDTLTSLGVANVTNSTLPNMNYTNFFGISSLTTQIMIINGTQCQNLSPQVLNLPVKFVQNSAYDESQTVGASVPLSALMQNNVNTTTGVSSCTLAFTTNSQNSYSIILGQAALQLFAFNVDTTSQTGQVSPTQQGLSMGASVQNYTAFSSNTNIPSFQQPLVNLYQQQPPVIQVGIGAAPNTTIINLLVDTSSNGMLIFGQPYSGGAVGTNSSYYNCSTCQLNQFGNFYFGSEYFSISNLWQGMDTFYVGQNQTQAIQNITFKYTNTQTSVYQRAYVNFTGISGMVGIGFLAQSFFQQPALGLRVDSSAQNWGWNPNYNSSIQSNPYVFFGGYNSVVDVPSNQVIFNTTDLYAGSKQFSFGSLSMSDYAFIMPDYQFLGVPYDAFNQIQQMLQTQLPSLVQVYDLEFNSGNSFDSVLVATTPCQNLINTPAYNMLLQVSMQTDSGTYFAQVPFNSLMANFDNNGTTQCSLGISNPYDDYDVLIGQSVLQSFIINTNTSSNQTQVSPTQQGYNLGARVGYVGAPQNLSSFQQPFAQLSSYQPSVITVGVGAAPNTSYINLLVSSTVGAGLTIFGTQLNGTNNAIYNCSTCTIYQFSQEQMSDLATFNGTSAQNTFYVGQNLQQAYSNLTFNYVTNSTSAITEQYGYMNLTNISGVVSFSYLALTTSFQQQQVGYRIDATQATWGWNPNYNPSVAYAPNLQVGSYTPLNTALSNVIETNYNTFYEAIISFSDLSGEFYLYPSSDYLYLGLPSNLYANVFTEIQELGINAQQIPQTYSYLGTENFYPYSPQVVSVTDYLMVVPNVLCQSLSGAAAYNTAFVVQNQNPQANYTLTYASVLLNSLMTNINVNGTNYCSLGITNQSNLYFNEITVGQNVLQSFIINGDYNTEMIQIQPTVQGANMGAQAGTVQSFPYPSNVASFYQPFVQYSISQPLVIQVGIGSTNTQILNLLVSDLDGGIIIFGEAIPGLNNSYYNCSQCQFNTLYNSRSDFDNGYAYGPQAKATFQYGLTLPLTMPNVPFTYVTNSSSFNTYAYTNWTGISGVIALGNLTMQQFQQQQVGYRIDATQATWGWNPNYNPNILANSSVQVGGSQPVNSASSNFLQTNYQNLQYMTLQFGQGYTFNVSPRPKSDYLYLGLSPQIATNYLSYLQQIQGFQNVTFVNLPQQQYTNTVINDQLLIVPNVTCQSLSNTTAFNSLIQFVNTGDDNTYYFQIQLQSLMTNIMYNGTSSCSLGISQYNYDGYYSSDVYIGQSVLQSFVVNINWSTQVLQIQPTQQGANLGASSGFIAAFPNVTNLAAIQQPFVQLSTGQPQVVTLGIGAAPQTTYLNFLVTSIGGSGITVFGTQFYNQTNSQYNCSTCQVNYFVNTDYCNFGTCLDGNSAYDTFYVGQNNGQALNLTFNYVTDPDELFNYGFYQNFTGISGFVGLGYLASLAFQQPIVSYRIDATQATWGWNPNYNPNITANPYVYAGAYTQMIGQSGVNYLSTSGYTFFLGNISFSGLQISGQDYDFFPSSEFLYLGLPGDMYIQVQNKIGQLGITTQNLTQSFVNYGFLQNDYLMVVPNVTCQSLSNTTAYNTAFTLFNTTANQRNDTFYASVLLNSMMSNINVNGTSYCSLGIAFQNNYNEVVIGQSVLQSFVINGNAKTFNMQIQPTPQGANLGAKVGVIGLPIPTPTSPVLEPYTVINTNQLVINVGVGNAPYTQFMNLLVDLQGSGLVLFGTNFSQNGQSVNNEIYQCTNVTGSCQTSTSISSWNSNLIDFRGFNYADTFFFGQNYTQVATNVNFIFQNTQPVYNDYLNLTKVGGMIGASSSYLTQAFTSNSFGLRMDASYATWGWNSNYNSNITPQNYFYFGNYSSITNELSVNLSLLSNSNLTVSFQGKKSTNNNAQIMPDYQFLGLDSGTWQNIYNYAKNQYQFSFQQNQWQVATLPLSSNQVIMAKGVNCQQFSGNSAYQAPIAISFFNNQTQTTQFISVSLASLMFNYGQSCVIAVAETNDFRNIWLGQALLQSFQLNVNYTTNTAYFAPTTQGALIGAMVGTYNANPVSSPTTSVQQNMFPDYQNQMIISVAVGTYPFQQTINMLVDNTLNDNMILFQNSKVNSANAKNQYYLPGMSSLCTSSQSNLTWTGSLVSGTGNQTCQNTVYLGNNFNQVFANFTFGLVNNVTTYQFINISQIGGVISARSASLIQNFGQSQSSFRMDSVSSQLLSWNPYYNKSIPTSSYFNFGGTTTLTGAATLPVSGNSGNAYFNNLTFTNVDFQVVPDFGFLGLPNAAFTKVAKEIQALGIPVVVYNEFYCYSNTSCQALYTNTSGTCQSYTNTLAFNTSFFLQFYNSSTNETTYISVPLNTLMTNAPNPVISSKNSSCGLAIYNLGNTSQIWLGQAFLQMFQTNMNYAQNLIQVAPTQLGASMGAVATTTLPPVASATGAIKQAYQSSSNMGQLVISVGVGAFPYTQQFNLLVDLQLEAAPVLLFGKNFSNNAIYEPSWGAQCNLSQFVQTKSNLIYANASVCYDTIYMGSANSYVIPNMQIGYALDNIVQYQYINWTGIAGVMSANSTYLTQYWGKNELGFRMDATQASAGWNPSYNSSLTPQQYFYFGSQLPLTTTAAPHAMFKRSLQATNDTNATTDVILANLSYGIATQSNLTITILPTFQYLGVPSLMFDAIWVQMNAYGIPVTPYQLSDQNSTWQILYVPGKTCQSFVNTTAFKTSIQILQYDVNSGATTNVSVPMSSLMNNGGSSCYVSLYNSTLSQQVLLGQAYLQWFQININYALTSPLQFTTTPQAADIGAVAVTEVPVPTPTPTPSPTPNSLSTLAIILISVSSFLFCLVIGLFICLGKSKGWFCKSSGESDDGMSSNLVEGNYETIQ